MRRVGASLACMISAQLAERVDFLPRCARPFLLLRPSGLFSNILILNSQRCPVWNEDLTLFLCVRSPEVTFSLSQNQNALFIPEGKIIFHCNSN